MLKDGEKQVDTRHFLTGGNPCLLSFVEGARQESCIQSNIPQIKQKMIVSVGTLPCHGASCKEGCLCPAYISGVSPSRGANMLKQAVQLPWAKTEKHVCILQKSAILPKPHGTHLELHVCGVTCLQVLKATVATCFNAFIQNLVGCEQRAMGVWARGCLLHWRGSVKRSPGVGKRQKNISKITTPRQRMVLQMRELIRSLQKTLLHIQDIKKNNNTQHRLSLNKHQLIHSQQLYPDAPLENLS